jgi:hypothetical protein
LQRGATYFLLAPKAQQTLVKGLHAHRLSGLKLGVELTHFAFSNQLANGRRAHHHFMGGNAA